MTSEGILADTLKEGNPVAETASREQLDRIFVAYIGEIKRHIHLALRRESNPALQTTDIAHEVYLRLIEIPDLSCDDLRKFFNLIAKKTREYLVDAARRRQAEIRGGKHRFVSLTFASHIGHGQPIDVLILDEALEKLAAESASAAEVAELRTIFGLSIADIAAITGRSPSTVRREWERAKLRLTDLIGLIPLPKSKKKVRHAG